jgi:hypothetical protein
MIRKMTFILAATAALGTVALAPTSASAFGKGGFGGGFGGGHHFGGGWGRGAGIGLGLGLVGAGIAAATCTQRQVIDTPYGPVVRYVNVCY